MMLLLIADEEIVARGGSSHTRIARSARLTKEMLNAYYGGRGTEMSEPEFWQNRWERYDHYDES